MKSKVNKALVFIGCVLFALLAIVANSHAQEVVIEEGDVCVAYMQNDSVLYALNLSNSDDLDVALITNTIDFTIDPITGEVYVARMLEIGSYQLQDLEGNVFFMSDNKQAGLDSFDGQLLFTDMAFTTHAMPESILRVEGQNTRLTGPAGWAAIFSGGLLFHLDQTTWVNGEINTEIKGNYPFAFNVEGTQMLSVDSLRQIWRYDVEENVSTNISFQHDDNLYVLSAEWLPNGNMMVATYDAFNNTGELWEYDGENLTLLFSRVDTGIWHQQVIPCDYLLEQ
jgi:hypothetical protein